MSLLIGCQNAGKSYGARPIFANLSLSFFQKDRLGLIGPNGSGKSTLLKILAGRELLDSGEISLKKGVSLAYLPQEDDLDSGLSVEQTLLTRLSPLHLEDSEKYGRVNKWLALARFDRPDQSVGELSGGWRKRLAIASVLVQEPDMLLLDEPTNHLDIEGILWLEDLLDNPGFAFILVTHDRYFLENVTNRIVEINRSFPDGFLEVNGNYSEYIYSRESMLASQQQLETSLANKVRRETEWLRRGPKARTSKARSRIEEAYCLKDQLAAVKDRNRQIRNLGIDFEGTQRKTKKLLTVKSLAKSMGGRNLFADISFTLSPGNCLGILGNNGTGKSTLIKLLNDELSPDRGEIRTGENVKKVVFEQDRSLLNLAETLKKSLSPAGDSVVYRGRSIHVASWAKRFLFSGDQLEMPIHQLSGGEQARILIARLMLQPADILMLDEPTNDLDIPSLEVLEQSLKDFPGAIVLVTHDRFLLDRLSTQILGLNKNGESGLFADCQQWISAQESGKLADRLAEPKTKPKSKPRKLSYKDQRELDGIEEKIHEAESALTAVQALLEDPDTVADPEKLAACCLRLESCQESVDRLYKRWDELETLKDEIES